MAQEREPAVKIESIDIQATIEKAQTLVREDKKLSAATKSIVEILIMIITLLAHRLNLNSTNSSKPPSSDPNRKKQAKRKTGQKPGGQNGHVGTTLKKVDDPDEIEVIKVDRSGLPAGKYRQVGFESRQVFDIDISRVVTEYRAQILEDDKGNRFVAPFPEGVTKAVQYGAGSKLPRGVYVTIPTCPLQQGARSLSDSCRYRSVKARFSDLDQEAFELLAGLKIGSKTSSPPQIWRMPMKRASISVVRDTGCTAYPMIFGRLIIPMKKGKRCHERYGHTAQVQRDTVP